MKKHINKTERWKRTQASVRKILREAWDPVGAGQTPEAHDEYDDYVGKLCELLDTNREKNKLADYLLKVEMDSMGLRGDRQRAERVANLLLQIERDNDC